MRRGGRQGAVRAAASRTPLAKLPSVTEPASRLVVWIVRIVDFARVALGPADGGVGCIRRVIPPSATPSRPGRAEVEVAVGALFSEPLAHFDLATDGRVGGGLFGDGRKSWCLGCGV